jgi:nitroreductase
MENSVNAIEALLTRRAVREFTPEPVAEEEINMILTAAMQAPSACNQQPWHFIVVDDREKLNTMAGLLPYAQMLLQAPLAVVVCGDLSLETCPGNWAIDCSAAMENVLLAVHAHGLGAVWVGIYPAEERVNPISQLLGLPTFAKPLCLAAVGHPQKPLPKVDRFKPERIHRNAW